ncbi:tetratricopeptide repeat protein [Lutimaribacter marinistellae]|uniref:Tetratricopeptide repeat protein n=1 Tax=Lutimaribacter marinistellae TaxID=1820329 RepID=A0ABV7TMU3_9RHOB
MKMPLILVLVMFAAGSAAAQSCPPPPDHAAQLDRLIEDIAVAEDEGAAQQISNQMWELWADAPDAAAQAILDRGMSKRAGWDLLGARAEFDRLVEYCPDYAEGYNQRAFVNFLAQNYAAALVDLDLALERSPRHVAAMSGKALSLLALGRVGEARDVLQEALALNPWLPERGLAAPGGPLEPPGDDI